jgi:hypothetical protein
LLLVGAQHFCKPSNREPEEGYCEARGTVKELGVNAQLKAECLNDITLKLLIIDLAIGFAQSSFIHCPDLMAQNDRFIR